MRKIVIGTRQSALALTQSGQVAELLRGAAREAGTEAEFELKKIMTKGDRILDVSLSKVGGKGLFVKEIEHALLKGEIDLAVHSMKDMPAELPGGLTIGGVPRREDPRDCLITRDGGGFKTLAAGARVGTSSLRRACQLKAARPDLTVEVLRGNIDSRLRRLDTGEMDAVILAAAGLHRMGWGDRVSEYLEPELCLPAVGQGALAVECRSGDPFILELLAAVTHEETRRAVAAERSFLHTLQGGCQVPIGAYATCLPGGRLSLTGLVGEPDGSILLKDTAEGSDPEALGQSLAQSLIRRGADGILAKVRSEAHE
ncbi:hydroxymethylbilane synthase [Paenibacillus sp. YN15]|uniref:hydroxymethylbilane synthase n=1 Tax=Paenibacillus sp. YN15 TaxID=1742774 RepID=UPI000DCD9E51|nr:hydroxymethylbilane synthase [Paenibacillus sp. YN15]RAV06351.1 hydroxymethylbilane synthase [Paenibacillus sp. YN15]